MQENLRIDIIGLGDIDLIVGFDWLRRHNPIIDFIIKC